MSRNFLIFGKNSFLHPPVSATEIPNWQLKIAVFTCWGQTQGTDTKAIYIEYWDGKIHQKNIDIAECYLK